MRAARSAQVQFAGDRRELSDVPYAETAGDGGLHKNLRSKNQNVMCNENCCLCEAFTRPCSGTENSSIENYLFPELISMGYDWQVLLVKQEQTGVKMQR